MLPLTPIFPGYLKNGGAARAVFCHRASSSYESSDSKGQILPPPPSRARNSQVLSGERVKKT